ncbi:integral membrane protein [Xylariales sp. AK1849]|nr:integral membrane protein [Xylariales sp. AK1849]
MTGAKFSCGVRGDAIKITDNLSKAKLDITFRRTIRVPDNAGASKLPPDLGKFPLYKVHDYASKLPAKIAATGGVFFPMYQKEAMWINFTCQTPFIIKIYAGCVNAISGEHKTEDLSTKFRRLKLHLETKGIQHYIVTRDQPWLDGIATSPGIMTGEEITGGLQFEITPAIMKPLTGQTFKIHCSASTSTASIQAAVFHRLGNPPDDQRLVFGGQRMEYERTLSQYGIHSGSTIYLVLRLRGGGAGPDWRPNTMGVAAGGVIEQTIVEDTHDPDGWYKDLTMTIPVHIINSIDFFRATCKEAPPSPIKASDYAEAGLPFFDMYEEESDISGGFDKVKSINEIEQERDIADGPESSVKPRVITLSENGHAAAKMRPVNVSGKFDDPDGLLDPTGPLRDFRTLHDLEDGLLGLTLETLEHDIKAAISGEGE